MIKKIVAAKLNLSIWQQDAFAITPKLYRLLILLSCFSFLAVYSTGYLRGVISLIALPVLVMLIWGRGLLRSPKVVQFLSLLVMIYSLNIYRGNTSGVIVLVEFTSLILFLQLQIVSNARTVGGVLILSLMLILVVAAMNVNFIFPLSLFPYLLIMGLVLTKISFLWHQKIAEIEADSRANRIRFIVRPWKFAVIIVAYLVLWISLFYLVPRSDAYGLASETSKRRLTGFSETLRLGEGGLLEDNPTVVMRIRPTDVETVSSSVLRRMRSKLLRGTTFPNYAGGRWYRSQSRRYFVDLRKTHGQFNIVDQWPGGKKLHQIEVILENTDPPIIFVPDQTVVTEFDASFIALESDYSMFFLGKTSGRRRYLCRLLIDPLEVRDVSVDDLDLQGYMRIYLSKIGIDPKIQTLADQISSNTVTVNQRVKATISYLRRNCTYSLYETVAPGTDPMVHFLFSSKSGSCEHFASAMTLLLRAMKVPARPVNGYTMGDWNELGGFFTVRQRHAHTWVEVFFPDSGWVPFDPSPPADLDEPEGEVEMLLTYLWEIYEGHWFNYVYNFDQNTQTIGFRKIFRAIDLSLTDFGRKLNQNKWFLIISLTLLFVFLNRLARRKRKIGSWLPLWYGEWETSLSLQRQNWETPREFHQRLLENHLFEDKHKEDLFELASIIDQSSVTGSDEMALRERAQKIIRKISG